MDGVVNQAPQPSGSNKNMLLIGLFVVIALAVIGGIFLMNQSKTATPADQAAQVSPSPEGVMVEVTEEVEPTGEGMTANDATTEGEVAFDIEASSFKFNPTTITVKKGDEVTINLTSKQGMHDWVVDEFEGARTKVLSAGGTDSITFTADKAGTYEFYCSIGNHRQMGMVGKLIVK